MSEILERGVFLNCLLDQTEAPWEVEAEMIRCHDAALRLALETANARALSAESAIAEWKALAERWEDDRIKAERERDDNANVILEQNKLWADRCEVAERERDEARDKLVGVNVLKCLLVDAERDRDAMTTAACNLRDERDRLSMQIVDAFTYFKESTAEQFCHGPEPTLVYQLVEQLFDAYKRVASNALHEAGEAKRLRAERDALQWLPSGSDMSDRFGGDDG